jgi:hypothetical protein
MTVAALAREFGVTRTTILRHLRLLGMPRSAPQSHDRWLSGKTRRDGACLRWTGARTGNGYPITHRNGTAELATRMIWQRQHGPIPSGLDVAHGARCRYRDCVRHSHLRLVDHATLAAELAAAGVYRHGERHWNAKLSEDQARYVLHSTRPASELAAEFGVRAGAIHAIRARRTWRHLR